MREALPLPSIEQLRLTDAYLRSFVADTSYTVRLQALFARTCLAHLRRGASDEILSHDLGSLVHDLVCYPNPEALGLDPLLVLETHNVVSGVQHNPSGLEPLVEIIAAELERQGIETAELGRVRLMRARLASMGYKLQPVKPARRARALLERSERWLSAPTPDIDDMVDHLSADDAHITKVDAELLALIAIAELRNYRLDIGGKIIRMLLQQHANDVLTREALQYLMLQRRNDGAYGFASPFDQQNWDRGQADRRIFLPLTLNVLWTLSTASAAGDCLDEEMQEGVR